VQMQRRPARGGGETHQIQDHGAAVTKHSLPERVGRQNAQVETIVQEATSTKVQAIGEVKGRGISMTSAVLAEGRVLLPARGHHVELAVRETQGGERGDVQGNDHPTTTEKSEDGSSRYASLSMMALAQFIYET
jgi:hypothetical protein